MTMILAVFYREARIRATSLTWMFFDLIMPLMYLMMFGVGLNTAFSTGITIDGESVSYTSFFLPGVLALSCFGIAINTSYGIFVDRDNGIFYELLTYPMTRGEFLVGKVLFNCLLALLQATLTLALGSLLPGVVIHWSALPVAAGAVVLGTAGWFFFLSIFSLRIHRNDMFNAFLNILYFVLIFASSLFYPVEQMPAWLRWISSVNPLTWQTDILRFGLLGTGTVQWVLLQAAGFLAFLGVSFGVSVATLRTRILE